eukprot:506200_1
MPLLITSLQHTSSVLTCVIHARAINNKQSDFLTNTPHDLSRHPSLNENKPKRTTSAISFSISPGFNQANQCKESKKKHQSRDCLMVNLLHKSVTNLLSGNTAYVLCMKILPITLSDCLESIAANVPHKDAIVYILYLSLSEWFNNGIERLAARV